LKGKPKIKHFDTNQKYVTKKFSPELRGYQLIHWLYYLKIIMDSFINDVMAFGGGDKDFVTTLLKLYYHKRDDGEG